MPVVINGSTGITTPGLSSSADVTLAGSGVELLNNSGRIVVGQSGSVIQVVSTNLTGVFSTATHGSWVDITGLSASITPSSSSSKILVMVQLTSGSGGNNYGRGYGVTRGGSQLNLGTYGTGSPGSFSVPTMWSGGDANILTGCFTYLDSPATTSSTTYQVTVYADSRSVTTTYINRTYNGDSTGSYGSSTITLMEIAG